MLVDQFISWIISTLYQLKEELRGEEIRRTDLLEKMEIKFFEEKVVSSMFY